MRQLKFRAWTKQEMIYEGWNGEFFATKETIFRYDEVMQYIGILDKNKKAIYEGDILLIEDEYTEKLLDDGSGPTEPFNHLAPVIFKDGSFGVDIKEAGNWFKRGFNSFYQIEYNSGQTEFESIGNIYENSDLIIN